MSQKKGKIPISSSSCSSPRHAPIHRNRSSKSKLNKGSASRAKFLQYSLLTFPPRSIFPTLTTLRSISNTRIDRLVSDLDRNRGQCQCQGQGQPSNNNDDVGVDATTFHQLETSVEVDSAQFTSDSEFSYDYETYMMHVAKDRKDCNNRYSAEGRKNYDKNCNIIPNTRSHYGGWMEDERLANCSMAPTPNSSFGLDLLDLSESLVVRLCSEPTSAVALAFRRSGTIPVGPIYEVSTKSGSPMLYMTETTNCMNRLLSCSWIGCTRLFMAHIVDVCGKLAVTVTNSGWDCACCCCLFCCCSSNSREFRVNLANGALLGTVCQTRGDHCNPGFLLRNSDLRKIIQADGPKFRIFDKLSTILSVICCCFSCLIDDDVFYFTEHGGGTRVAEIRKVVMQVSTNFSDGSGGSGGKDKGENTTGTGTDVGVAAATYQDDLELELDDLDFATCYEIIINFAPNLSLRKKALILSASFVIDFLYWQSSSDSY